MKFSSIPVGTGLMMATAAMAQGQPTCGAVCISNMQAEAAALGCGDGDVACLCGNPDFTYGIRDCSFQSCGSDAEAQNAVASGVALCRDAGVAIADTPETTVIQPTGTATVTATPIVSSIVSVLTTGGTTITSVLGVTTINPISAGQSQIPGIVSSFTTVITSGESTFTSVGPTTISGVSGTASEPQTDSASTIGLTTTLQSSETGSIVTSDMSTETGTATATDTPQESTTATGDATSASASGLAPQQTAGAAGILAVAGLAAMLI